MSPSAAPLVVLDTNVILDLFFFQDAGCARLLEAISADRCRWIASQAMRAEVDHVLQRGLQGAWPGDADTVGAAWARWATEIEPDGRPPRAGMRCTDADDQKFIDLALQIGARSLLSADRAVLRLARRGRDHGLDILTVKQWTARMRRPEPCAAQKKGGPKAARFAEAEPLFG